MFGINRFSSARACTSTKHLNITTTVVTFLDKQLQKFGIFRGRDNCLLQNYIKNTVNNISCRNIMAAPILAPTVKLNNGYEMPVLGLGTYQLKKGKCENIIRQAINIGYRHVDTAYLYGNEVHIGKSLKQLFEENVVKRSDIFVCTKLWSIFHEPQRVKYACRRQLNDLHLDYIDLYLMHSPTAIKYNNDADLMPHENGQLCTDEVDYVATYKAMEKLVSMGWVRSLGLSNFNAQQITRILANCQIKPVVNQVECHPGLNQEKLRTFCQEHDIIICAYSPLARPKLTKPLPEFYNSPEVEQLAEFYGKTKAQIVLRYLVDIGTVPLPKTSTVERLLENISIFDFQLTRKDIAVMNGLNKQQRLWRNIKAQHHKYYPFRDDF